MHRVSNVLHAASLTAVAACVALWMRGKTVSQEERGNAERRALFVGLWPPLLWLLGDAAETARLHQCAACCWLFVPAALKLVSVGWSR